MSIKLIIACSAHVQDEEVLSILEHEKKEGNLEYSHKTIRFFKEAFVNERHL